MPRDTVILLSDYGTLKVLRRLRGRRWSYVGHFEGI
jgi:hypothetical protein